MKQHYSPKEHATAIVLSGGGARAAYQVGVLQAISRLRQKAGEEGAPTPFPIVVGTSAGAINAAALACSADHFAQAVQRLSRVWRNFSSDQVFFTDELPVSNHSPHWMSFISSAVKLAHLYQRHPVSLLNNRPLLRLLEAQLPLERIPRLFHARQLDAVAVTGSNYTTGEHIVFYEAASHVPGWSKTKRRAVQARITHHHLMASTAIPLLFPPEELYVQGQYNYFGDGAVRHATPLAPAVHLGAKRIVVIDVGEPQQKVVPSHGQHGYPPHWAQIVGHLLNNIFLDAIPMDIERAQHVNRTLSLMTAAEAQDSGLRALDILVFSPSRSLNTIAQSYMAALQAPVFNLLGASSAPNPDSASLASYLLFERGYTRAVIDLGRQDAMERKDEICAFFGWHGACTELNKGVNKR